MFKPCPQQLGVWLDLEIVFADVIRLTIGLPGLGWVPWPVTGVLRAGDLDTETPGGGHVVGQVDVGAMQQRAEDCRGPLADARARRWA